MQQLVAQYDLHHLALDDLILMIEYSADYDLNNQKTKIYKILTCDKFGDSISSSSN